MKNKALSFYTGVFLLSGLVMALQILQSRILSVTSWYHLSFLVISMAMFGLTLGALKVYRSNEEEQRKNYGLIARKHSMAFGLFILVALFFQLYFPIFSKNAFYTLGTLPVAALTISIAYYHAGVAITICLTRAPFPVGKTYGIDLLGAGIGCIVALILMETIDTPSAIFLISGIAFISALLFPVDEKDKDHSVKLGHGTYVLNKTAKLFFAGTFAIAILNAAIPSPIFYPLWVKNVFTPTSRISYEDWNSISRVTVLNEEANRRPFAWGPSPLFPDEMKITGKMLIIDGDAGTPIIKFDGDFSKHSYLEYDVTNIAYNLPNINKSVVIGVGGGRDLLSAKYFGVKEVTALDVNPVQIDLLRDHPEYREYANLYNQPGVKIINEEARSWFRQNDQKLDLVQMSLIDTWAATGAGAFALSENGLYTVEAWEIFMDNLSENGVFTLSRWSANVMDDTGRALSVAMATLFNQGSNPRDHIAMINSENIATLILSKSPFTYEQIVAIEKTAKEKQYTLVLMPNKPAPDGILGDLIIAKDLDDLYAISDRQFFDVSPSTDMRPFFFNQARLTKPWDVAKLALMPPKDSHHVSMGQAKATFNLYLIVLFSAVMVAFTIVMPLLKTVENKTSPIIMSGTLYFMLIGLGFMFMEISLLQALGVFLGHPIYGLGVVLFSLIISAGLGSLVSEKIKLSTLPRQLAWCFLTCAYAITMSLILKDLFYTYAEVTIMSRVLISIAIISPAGFLMGFGFPTGLLITEKHDSRATAWFWGINGATGVLGSSIAIALNISMGIDKTLVVAGVCYALICIPFLILANCKTKLA